MDRIVDTLIVGAGQAGLATGFYLARRGADFEIVERHGRVGESWRRRWAGLRAFTPARLNGLPGLAFPGPPGYCPTKDEIADFLERYAREMALPIRLGVGVRRLSKGSTTRFAIETDDGGIVGANDVVVASGAWHTPRVPPFAGELSEAILQLHSSKFCGAAQLKPGRVLVVGGGNSGAEIAAIAAREHETWLVGRDTGQMPFDIDGPLAPIADRALWFLANHVLTVGNPLGRRARGPLRDHGAPLERIRKRDLAAAGVKRVAQRVEGVRDGLPVLADGRFLEVANVIWATGYRPDYRWIELSETIIGEDGWPLHERGISSRVAGLHFVGLPFQYSLASALLGGVGRDARFVADRIAAKAHEEAPLTLAV